MAFFCWNNLLAAEHVLIDEFLIWDSDPGVLALEAEAVNSEVTQCSGAVCDRVGFIFDEVVDVEHDLVGREKSDKRLCEDLIDIGERGHGWPFLKVSVSNVAYTAICFIMFL